MGWEGSEGREGAPLERGHGAASQTPTVRTGCPGGLRGVRAAVSLVCWRPVQRAAVAAGR